MSSDSGETSAAESVLSRWSRRKLEAEQPPAVETANPEPVKDAVTEVAREDAAVEPKPLTDADMPEIDTLHEDSDFSPFMSSGVSDELRNLALRKLFHAPVFNIRDGLDEYDEDYTSFEKLGDIVTADMKHQAEMQQQKMREALQREEQIEVGEIAEDIEDIEDIEDEDTITVAADEASEEVVVDETRESQIADGADGSKKGMKA